jgi:Flp pilus assembly protein TadD
MMTFPNGGIGFNTPYKSQKYHYRNALDEYQAGNVYSAKIILEMLLEKKPNYSNALNLLGLILNELGNPDEALVFLNKAYSLSNDEKILQNINLVKENPGKKLGISLD